MDQAHPNDSRFDVAGAIADGAVIDWLALERHASSDEQRRFLRRLRRVAVVVQAHSSLTDTEEIHESIRSPGGLSAQATAPVTWGSLQVLEKLGRGAFGDVYRAHDARLGRDVALKLLRRREKDTTDTAIAEGQRLARVRHPHVVTVYGAERIDGRTGIWMELLPGGSLADEIQRGGPMDPRAAAAVVRDLAGALAAIHDAGLVHRDVKPGNVLRDASGRAVLTDFGAGGELESAEAALAGTPLYLAPEVLRGEPATPQGDVYSLGVLLYYLLTGAHPVEGRTFADVARAHAEQRVTPLAARRRVPRDLAAVVARAIDADPARRFATAAAFAAALTPPASPRRKAYAAAAALTVATVAALAVAWQYRFGDGGEAPSLVQLGGDFRPRTFIGGLSRDGRTAVCSDGERRQLGICNLETGAIQLLDIAADGDPDGSFAHFSPDGGRIVYPRAVGKQSRLHVVNADGTGDRVLFTPAADEWFLRPGGWSADGHRVVADLRRFDMSHDLVLIDVRDGQRRVLRRFGPNEPIVGMTISPDGRHVAYDLPKPGASKRDVVVTATDSGASTVLLDAAADDFAPLWSPDGDYFVFMSDRNGTLGLWRQPMSGGAAAGEATLLVETVRDTLIAKGFAGDGRSALFARFTGGPDVFRARLDLSGAPMTASRVSPRLLDINTAPAWSADGQYIAYVSSRVRFGIPPGGTRVVVQQSASGVEREWPIEGMPYLSRLRWWPDGQSLLLARSDARTPATVLDRFDAATGRHLQRLKDLASPSDAIITPDGTRMLYRVPGEIRELTLSDGSERPLIRSDETMELKGSSMSLSPDGEWLAFSASTPGSKESEVRLLSRTSGAIEHLATSTPIDGLPLWIPGTSSMLAVKPPSGPNRQTRLLSVTRPGGEVKELGLTVETLLSVRVSPDGKEIVFAAGASRTERWLLRNLR